MESWDPEETRIGNLFSKLLWNKYEEYRTIFLTTTLPLLRDKMSTDEDFVAFCRLRQGPVKYSIEDLLHLPLERLAHYEQYLRQLAAETADDHPDYGDICRVAKKATSMVKRNEAGKEESDLDRIQELFPSDNLRLHERDPLSPRKGLMRTKSLATGKFQRAFPGKSKTHSGDSAGSPPKRDEHSMTTVKKPGWRDENYRTFLMDNPVQFNMGLQNQDRHLFLFNDLLLIAKLRSGGTYKLKDKVRLCEMWLSHCIADVCESTKSQETSFVVGWPTTNVVFTFSSQQIKDAWHEKLQQLIAEAKEREGDTLTSIQINYWNPNTKEEFVRTVKVNNRHSARNCIQLLLQEWKSPAEAIASDFQLWVKTGKDDSPYPLIGHEYPFCIKMNFIREVLQRSDLDLQNFNNISADTKCCFILRRCRQRTLIISDPGSTKKRKKHRRPHRINWPFKRNPPKQDSQDSGNGSPPPRGLFGKSLSKMCPDNNLPKPIVAILTQLFQKGPFTVGIFRKSANARSCREMKEKLEAYPDVDLQDISVLVVASVFKEFLRSLPDCLLQSELYNEWLQAVSKETDWECREHVRSLLGKLPAANLQMLRYTLCILWHISQHSLENKMPSTNLAVCIGPSLLKPPNRKSSPVLQQEEVTKQVPRVVAYLIDHCPSLLGEDCLHLLGDFPQRDSSRQDSGAEESDSLHSLQDLGGGYRRDDSSIDSLDRDFLDESEPSPKLPCKSKMSLTNLSRDSGLTLSDTQLYAPEEEAESEASCSEIRRVGGASLTKSVPHLDSAGLEVGSISLYRKNAGVIIDGTCPDVVRKRKQGLENRQKAPLSTCHSQSFPLPSGLRNSHVPLQLSKSYGYSMQHDLIRQGKWTDGNQNGESAARRESRGRRHCDRPVKSAVEPLAGPLLTSRLRRTTSEESLLQGYAKSHPLRHLSPEETRRAPSPPPTHNPTTCNVRRDQPTSLPLFSGSINGTPDRHALWFASQMHSVDWKRSQSTSKINEIDQSRDSSTLSLDSGDESTPHGSPTSGHVQDLSSQSQGELYSIYYSPPRVSSVCSSSSEGSQQSNGSCSSWNSHKSHGSNYSQGSEQSNVGSTASKGSPKPLEPPSYQEALTRRSMLQRLQTTSTTTTNAVHSSKVASDQVRSEQTNLSAKARELYENSVRIYKQHAEAAGKTHHAVPAKVSIDTPIVQKAKPVTTRTSSDGASPRLKQLPPVHVTDAQLAHFRAIGGPKVSPRQQQQQAQQQQQGQQRQQKNELPEDLRKEISWSVAQLRTIFSTPQASSSSCKASGAKGDTEAPEDSARNGRPGFPAGRTRTSSTESRTSGEESFV